jgi:hypothetical protein
MADSKKDGKKDDYAATMAKHILTVSQHIAKGLEADKKKGGK